jgi:hypothetical protein
MNTETLISVGALIAVASLAFICVWLVCKRLQTVRNSYLLAGVLWAAVLASMWFTDTNVRCHKTS